MNNKNANQELGFDDFAHCDYNLHWSFSNFNRMIIAAGKVASLPRNSVVMELGAGTSKLETYVHKNFGRDDIYFIKIDGDKRYDLDKNVHVMDITSDEDLSSILWYKGILDCIIYMEVIEHLDEFDAIRSIRMISDWLKPGGLMLLTTPTPPKNGRYESSVWPLDHDREYPISELRGMINHRFKIVKEVGWSLDEREYNELIETDSTISAVYGRLRDAFPESFIRSVIACIAGVYYNRQIFMICKKRRSANGFMYSFMEKMKF